MPAGHDATQVDPERRVAEEQEVQVVLVELQVRQIVLSQEEQEEPERKVPSGQVLRQVRL